MIFFFDRSLIINEWLTAFVAIERAFITIKQINFNKNRFKQIAKWTIISLIFVTILTNIHDPIHRTLFKENENDDENQRYWCVVKYTSSLIQMFNKIIIIIHFFIPFLINLISAIIIILLNTRQRIKIQKQKQQFKSILNEQIHQHKNLLIAPCVLIILGIPRLIISFTFGCMKTSKDSWLFLSGYYISLIPPLLTFILFVLPSSTYKQAFKKQINHYRNLIHI